VKSIHDATQPYPSLRSQTVPVFSYYQLITSKRPNW